MAAQVPNIFVEQYDQGQKKIRADLMDENFAYVCQQLDANADTGSAAADAAAAAQATADGKANADLDDVTAAGKAVMAHAAMPDPSRVVQLSIPTQTIASWPTGYYQWTAPVDCCVSIQTSKAPAGSAFLRVAFGAYTTADAQDFLRNTVAADEDVSGATNVYLSVNFFVPKDQTITIVHNCPGQNWGKYFPCIGTAS